MPEHFSWNPLRAVYRLCNRPEVTHSAVTATHFSLTRRRMEQANTTILILHDTTELNFTSHSALEGTGPVGNGQGRGFLQHNSLAIEADTRKILGLAFQQVTTRHARPQGRDPHRQAKAAARIAVVGTRHLRRGDCPGGGVLGRSSPTAAPIASRR